MTRVEEKILSLKMDIMEKHVANTKNREKCRERNNVTEKKIRRTRSHRYYHNLRTLKRVEALLHLNCPCPPVGEHWVNTHTHTHSS